MAMRKAMKAMSGVKQSDRFGVYLERCGRLWVYLIGNREYGWYKIGITHWPENRLKQLENTPFELELITAVAIADRRDRSHALSVEKKLHEAYKEHHLRGEWFRSIDTKDFLTRVKSFTQRY